MDQYVTDYRRFQDTGKALGRGSNGTVKCMKDPQTNEFYAVKLFPPSNTDNIQFVSEIDIVSKFQHPCIVQVVGYFLPDSTKSIDGAIIMEFVDGPNLRTALDTNLLNSEDKETIICGVALGMKFLHSKNYLHRDLKPENIVLGKKNLPKITDFGLAKQNSDENTVSCGTFCYMAPETSQSNYDAKVDVFSFGMVVYDIFFGKPFPELQGLAAQIAIINGTRPKIPSSTKVPSFYLDLIQRCWSQDPGDRPSFAEVCGLLEKNYPLVIRPIIKLELKRMTKKELISLITDLWDDEKELSNSIDCVTLRNDKLLEDLKVADFSFFTATLQVLLFFFPYKFRAYQELTFLIRRPHEICLPLLLPHFKFELRLIPAADLIRRLHCTEDEGDYLPEYEIVSPSDFDRISKKMRGIDRRNNWEDYNNRRIKKMQDAVDTDIFMTIVLMWDSFMIDSILSIDSIPVNLRLSLPYAFFWQMAGIMTIADLSLPDLEIIAIRSGIIPFLEYCVFRGIQFTKFADLLSKDLVKNEAAVVRFMVANGYEPENWWLYHCDLSSVHYLVQHNVPSLMAKSSSIAPFLEWSDGSDIIHYLLTHGKFLECKTLKTAQNYSQFEKDVVFKKFQARNRPFLVTNGFKFKDAFKLF